MARMKGDEAEVAQIEPRGMWPLLLAIPAESLATEKARQVLPEHYSRSDTVTNIQNSMLLLAAFSLGRRDLAMSALDDRLHQPYRAGLCPLLEPLQALAGSCGVLGAVLSGAGPSVLIFLDRQVSGTQIQKKVAEHLKGRGLIAELIPAKITQRGGRAAWRK